MSDSTNSTTDPFDPAPPDEETELAALANALQLAKGFTLLFARCNLPAQRQRLIADLRKRQPHLNIQEIEFREPIYHLLDELRARIASPPPDAVFVSGLEYSLPVAATADNTPLVANLNAARNSFSRYVLCPLVLWVPEYVLTAIMHGAPDFFSVRSGTYYFMSTLPEAERYADLITNGEEWDVEHLALSERKERIAHIQGLLEDYRAFPEGERDYKSEGNLLSRLATLCSSIGEWSKAEEALQQVLEITRQAGARSEESRALLNLGAVYQKQCRWDEAAKVYECGLALAQELGEKTDEGRALYNLGTLYAENGDLTKAQELYAQSMTALQGTDQTVVIGEIFSNLADIYQKQEQYEKAEEALQQSLAICQANRDRYREAIALFNLALVYSKQGKFSEAIKVNQKSKNLRQQLGDQSGLGDNLATFGLIYLQQGQIDQAEMAFQQSLDLMQKSENLIGQGRALDDMALLRTVQGNLEAAIQLEKEALQVLGSVRESALKAHIQERLAELEQLLCKQMEGK